MICIRIITIWKSSHPFASYGGYVLTSWDENARLVFNKNYEYVARETINYKSYVVEIVADTAEAYNLFKNGDTSVLGLTKDYYAEYAEDQELKTHGRIPTVYDY